MKVLIFTEGTILMHKNALGQRRKEIVKQVEDKEESISDYASYVPIGNAVAKLQTWADQGAEILYLTSRTKFEEIEAIRNILRINDFPTGELYSRKEGETYADVAERIVPDILIEDDCESIGGEPEMTITNINPEVKRKIKSVVIKEFGGVDHLPDSIGKL